MAALSARDWTVQTLEARRQWSRLLLRDCERVLGSWLDPCEGSVLPFLQLQSGLMVASIEPLDGEEARTLNLSAGIFHIVMEHWGGGWPICRNSTVTWIGPSRMGGGRWPSNGEESNKREGRKAGFWEMSLDE